MDRSNTFNSLNIDPQKSRKKSLNRASKGESDLSEAVTTAVINKRAGGMGLISGRKAFQKPVKEGVELLNNIQDVYLTKEIDIA